MMSFMNDPLAILFRTKHVLLYYVSYFNNKFEMITQWLRYFGLKGNDDKTELCKVGSPSDPILF